MLRPRESIGFSPWKRGQEVVVVEEIGKLVQLQYVIRNVVPSIGKSSYYRRPGVPWRWSRVESADPSGAKAVLYFASRPSHPREDGIFIQISFDPSSNFPTTHSTCNRITRGFSL